LYVSFSRDLAKEAGPEESVIEPEAAVNRPKKRKHGNLKEVKLESVYEREFN
jgi:hypothetical protein